MKLHKIKLKNFRCFEEFEIEFDPEFMLHVLIAENMVGKSALLRALRIMLGSYLKGFTGNNLEPGITRNDHRIIGTNPLANLARQCEIQAEASLVQPNGKQVNVSWKRYKTQLLSERTKTQNLSGDLSSLAADQYDATVAGKGCLPLLLFISPDSFTQARNTRQFELQGAALQGYWYSLQAKSISAFVLDFLERMEQIREEQVHKESTKRLYEDLPQTFLDFFQKILQVTLPEIEAVEWIRDPNHNQANAENEEDSEAAPQSAMTLSFIFDDGRVCLYDMLSDGYRYLTLLAGELAIRSLLLNRHLGVEVGNHISGVVLIDEFGIHLHPGLQQKALQRLASAFPKVHSLLPLTPLCC